MPIYEAAEKLGDNRFRLWHQYAIWLVGLYATESTVAMQSGLTVPLLM
jgi:hypothetical protein